MEDLNIYCYPKEIIKVNNKQLLNNIIKGHDKEKLKDNEKSISRIKALNHFKIDKPVAQFINNYNIYTSCINDDILIGLIFENEDNPYDYKNIFEELLTELLNNGNGYSFEEEMEIDNLLISIFIDLRRFGDEVVERTPEIEFYFQREAFFKVFLFGIDEVGKTSLVRRVKTGEFNDNYFTPTRKFNIEYIQVNDNLLAIWDLPGQLAFRSRWLKGLQGSNIIVYMIDISNQRRFEESKREMWKMLSNKATLGIPFLILCNKIDLITNFEKQEEKIKDQIYNYLELDQIKDREWNLIFISVKTKTNIDTALKWIGEFKSLF
ncbi:MAG: ADP-ribosylation factor-like protein [Candidatus Thorarchaeota archaeon]